MVRGIGEASVSRGQLAADDDQTILVWEERRRPLDQLAAYGVGIQVHVEDLAAYLAGRERCDAARFDELLPTYQEWPSTSASYHPARRWTGPTLAGWGLTGQ